MPKAPDAKRDRIPPTELWGVTADLLPLDGGHRNMAFRTAGLRQDLVFKSTRRKPEAVEWLLPVLELARKCGLVVPAVLRSCRQGLVEAGWTCEEFVEGRRFASREVPCIRTRVERFHVRAARVPQRPGQVSSRDLLELDSGGDIDLGSMPPWLAEACRASWSGHLTDDRCTVVHGDLNPDNMLRCPDGRIALVDWDECRRDLPVFDIGHLAPVGPSERRALLAWEVACSWTSEPGYARRLAGML
ncbi:MAG: phosphotransferase [Boseongicola sp.]|nr:phosphotransferase [Boseongicola sp.]